MKRAFLAGAILTCLSAYAFGGGQISVMDPITKLPKYIKGGTGIDINPGTGIFTATGTAVISGSIPFSAMSSAGNAAYLAKIGTATNTSAYKGNSAPTGAEFGYVAGATSNLQSQLNSKATTVALTAVQSQVSSVKVTAESKPDLSNVTPSMNGIALAGTGPTASRVDHVHPVDTSREPANANIQAHISSTSNPHSVTKSQVGLGNVDNTSDLAKPISTATQTALNLKANTTSLATVATTGSYTDLTNKPAVYTLPTASTTVKGGVKVDGTSIVVDGNGVISSTVSAGVSTVNGATGDVTVTPANIGAAALAAFTNYTTIDRVTKADYDAAAARSIPKTGTFTASLDTFLAIYGTAAVTLPSIPADGFAHNVAFDTFYKTNSLSSATVNFGGTTFYVDGAATTSYTLPLKGSTVFSNYSGTWHGSTRATAAQGAKADAAYNNARKGSAYTVLPYGDTRTADYYCSATDCGVTFQTVFDLIKASGKGGNIKVLEGTYPFTTSVAATDADSVSIEGITPIGMWAGGGSIFLRKANISLFNFSDDVGEPSNCDISRIHFADYAAGYTAPLLKYVNAHNMGQFRNYFNDIPQAIFAERAWDFWTAENNFRDCGTGDTKTTACIAMYNGDVDQVSGWMIYNNRFETRPGTSIYSDASGTSGGAVDGANTIKVIGNKFEGTDGSSFPAVHGVFWSSIFIGNSVFNADIGKPAFWIVNAGEAYSGANVVQNNTVSSHKDYALSISGDGNNVGGNSFYTQSAPSAHIRIATGVNNTVGANSRADSIALLSDAGTGTVDTSSLVSNTTYNPTSWDGDSTHAPSKDAVRDKIESLATQISAAGGGTVVNVSSADSNATVTSPTTSPVITVVSAPKLQTPRVVFGETTDFSGNVGQDLKSTASPTFASETLTVSYGTTLTTNGTFDDFSSWGGTNWTWGSGKWTHTAGSTSNFGPSVAITPSIGTVYRLTFDISGVTAGTLTPSFGGSTGPVYAANGTNITVTGVATTTGNLVFAPSSDFNGSIDNVLFQPVTGGALAAAISVDSAGNFSGRSIAITNGDAPPTVALSTSVDAAGNNPIVSGRKSRGTAAAPTATQSGDTLLSLAGYGYGSAWFSTASTQINMVADESFTSSAKGAHIDVATTATGTTSRSTKMRVHGSGCVSVGSIADCGVGNISVLNFIISGFEEKTASYTVSKDSGRITLASSTAVITLPKTLKAGETSVLVTVAGAAASGVSFAAESGGSVSFGDAGAPAFTNNKTADVVCISQNSADTTTAAWRCTKGGNF